MDRCRRAQRTDGAVSVTRVCEFCHQPVDPDARTTYTRVTGWERKAQGVSRRNGSDIVLREREAVYACGGCVTLLRTGVPVTQGSLL
jgi:hypothetical protein